METKKINKITCTLLTTGICLGGLPNMVECAGKNRDFCELSYPIDQYMEIHKQQAKNNQMLNSFVEGSLSATNVTTSTGTMDYNYKISRFL